MLWCSVDNLLCTKTIYDLFTLEGIDFVSLTNFLYTQIQPIWLTALDLPFWKTLKTWCLLRGISHCIYQYQLMRVKRTQFDMSFLKDASNTSHTSRDEQNDGHLRAFGIHCEPGAAIAGEVKSGNTFFYFSLPRDCLVVSSAMKCVTLLISASGKVFLQVHLKCFYWPSRSRKFTHFELNQEKSC